MLAESTSVIAPNTDMPFADMPLAGATLDPDLEALLELCESAAERLFLYAAYDHIEGLVPQHPAFRYWLDFAVPDKWIAIEIDGHDYHKTQYQIKRDAKRERELLIAGWKVVRFTAAEVFWNVTGCVAEVAFLIDKMNRHNL